MIINHPGQSENLLSRIILLSCRKPWLFLKDPLMLLTLRGIYLNLSEVSKPICTGSFTLEHYKLKNCGCWWYKEKIFSCQALPLCHITETGGILSTGKHHQTPVLEDTLRNYLNGADTQKGGILPHAVSKYHFYFIL